MSVKNALGYDGYSLPVGTVLAYAGVRVPQKYLLCDGSTVSAAQYPLLFDAIEYTYGGVGDSFDLPILTNNIINGTAINTGTNTPSSVASATFNATLVQDNIPSIPSSQFNIDAGLLTITTGLGGNNNGIAVGTASQVVVPTTSSAGISCFASNGSPLRPDVNITFNSMTIEYTGTNTPIAVGLADIECSPKSYSMLYIIKAEY